MRVSPSKSLYKEKTIVKRLLLVVASAVLLLNTLVVPNVARADGPIGTSCGGSGYCKP
jgi:hypothetical protein